MRHWSFLRIFAANSRMMLCIQTNRDELRPKVVRTAMEMFMTAGFDSVRMDDIASRLSVSKRTLYEMFGSKEDLLIECIHLHQEIINGKIRENLANNDDVLSSILSFLEVTIKEFDSIRKLLMSSCSEKIKADAEAHVNEIREQTYRSLALGMEQGMFRNDIDIDILLQEFQFMGKLVADQGNVDRERFERLVNSTHMVLLRGIATVKGLEQIDEYLLKHNNRQ